MTTPHATTRTVQALQLGQHLLGALLLVVCTLRALRTSAAPLATLGVAAALVLVYGVGTYLARRRSGSRPALLWLLALTLLWACALIVSAEFSWFAFVLWLLGGHLLGAATGVGYTVVVLSAAVAAPGLHHQQIDTAAVVGPTVGALFAWGLARGQVQLVRDMEERERLTAALAEAERQAGVDAERTRVSREVHDTLAQGFSSIVLLARAGGPGALARIRATPPRNPAPARRGRRRARPRPAPTRRPAGYRHRRHRRGPRRRSATAYHHRGRLAPRRPEPSRQRPSARIGDPRRRHARRA